MSNTPSSETVDDLLERLFESGGLRALEKDALDDCPAGDDVELDQAKASLRQAVEGMIAEVIGEDDPVSEGQPLEQNYANDVGNAFRRMQRQRAKEELSKMFPGEQK